MATARSKPKARPKSPAVGYKGAGSYYDREGKRLTSAQRRVKLGDKPRTAPLSRKGASDDWVSDYRPRKRK